MTSSAITAPTRTQLERVERWIADHDDALAVPRESGEFLHALVLSGGFHRGLEIGTSYGYSGLWLGSAFQHNGGTLVTIDREPRKTGFARQAFRDAGLANVIRVEEGVAADVLGALRGPFDFVFVDADKENSLRYFELFWPLLEPRATIVTDNIVSHEEALAAYVNHLRSRADLCSVLVRIGSGLEVTVGVASPRSV